MIMEGDKTDFIPASEAARSKRWLHPLSLATVERMCRDGILIASKLGNNNNGRGHWFILKRSLIAHKLKANTQHL